MSFAFIACSGATIRNVDSGGDVQAGEPGTQLDQGEVAAETDLVTLTLGGNDAEFGRVMEFCGRNPCLDPNYKPVDGIPFTEWIENKIASLGPSLETSFSGVRSAAPDAITTVMGYPRLFPDTLSEQTCIALDNIIVEYEPTEQDYLNERAMQLNDIVAGSAEATGNTYVGVAERFTNHEVCADGGEWVRGPSLPINASFHPNELGHIAYASAVNQYLLDGSAEPSTALSSSSATMGSFAGTGSIKTAAVEGPVSSVIECGEFEIVRPGGVMSVSGTGYEPGESVRIRLLEKDGHVPLQEVHVRADNSGSIDQAMAVPLVLTTPSLQVQAVGAERDGGDLLLWAPVTAALACDDPQLAPLSA